MVARVMSSVVAIVVAAGRGERLGVGQRKQYVELGGVPILVRTLRGIEACAAVDSIVLAIPGDDGALVRDLVARHGLGRIAAIVEGGQTRRDSVARALAEVPGAAEVVLVHDGVRPLLSVALVERVIDAARAHGAAVPVLPPKDTIKRGGKGWLSETLDRSTLWLAQTPQGFRADLLRRAHAQPGADATDDAQLVERLGQAIASVFGEPANLKITTPEDVVVAEALLAMRGR
jgi:2-C-methyl-D-erythritol 4-phosphate cytidylyltransferase